ncbi:MAG: VWA domain-containing protein [Candidatus Diapherotrites archaeon]
MSRNLSSHGFAFTADVVLAFILAIGIIIFATLPTHPIGKLEERRITDQYVDDLFVALDHSGYVSHEIDVNGFSMQTLQNVYTHARTLLPNSYDFYLQMQSYPLDISACQSSQDFVSCFPDANVQTLTTGTALPTNAPFVHGRRIFIKQQPASECSGALSSSIANPFAYNPFLTSLSLQSLPDINIQFDVNVTPPGPWTCDQNISVTLSVTTNSGARKPVDMMLVIDRSGSMSYDYLLETTDAQAVALDGNYAFLADSTSGLRDIDATDPGIPALVDTYNTSGTARDVTVSNNYAYLADGTSGLHIFDVSNPSNALSISALDVGGDAYGVATIGNQTYLVTYSSTNYDISNTGSTNNQLYIGRSSSELYGAQSFTPTIAFISGAQVLVNRQGNPSGNITVSVRSSLTGSDLVSGTISSGAVSTSYQYVNVVFPSILPLVPGNTYYLVLTTTATSSSNYYRWGTSNNSYSGGQAYQNTSSQNRDARFQTHFIPGLVKIDTTSKSSPFVLGAYPLTSPWRVFLDNNVAYVADGSAGVHSFNISGNTPILLDTYNTSGTAYDVLVSGNVAYVSDGTSGLRTLDVSTPSSMVLLDTYNTPGTAYATKVDNAIAYVADGSSVYVVDATAPSSLSVITYYSTPWNYRDIELRTVDSVLWGYLAVDSGIEGLATVNLDTGPKISQAQSAALTFVDFNGWDSNYDQMGLVSYSSTASTDQTLTSNFDLVKSDIAALVANGSTATGYAINNATTELTSIRHNPIALPFQILLSDGLTNTGTSSSSAAITAANSGIIIYTIGFGKDADETELQNIATITGGKYYAAADQNALIDVYNIIAKEIQLIASDANLIAGISDQLIIVDDGNGLLSGTELIFDINTLEPQPWVAEYTINIPCNSQLACSSTLLSIPSPGTHFEYVDANGTTQMQDWNVFSTSTFEYADLNISILSGDILGTNNVDLTVKVESIGNLDTISSSVSFYRDAPPTHLLSTVSIPPLCGQLNPGCVNYSYEFMHNVSSEGELYAVVNPDYTIPECTFNDQDVIFCYYTPSTQFFTFDYWAWLRG